VEEFKARGFINVKALEGGVQGWKDSLAKATSFTA
jgi:rhodanese-related sulfurtransferase